MEETQTPTLAPAGEAINNQRVQQDYFGFSSSEKFFFPDEVTYIEYSKLNEGQKARFQNSSNSEITLKKNTGDAAMKMAPGTSRHELIKAACVGWNLVRDGQKLNFSEGTLRMWLDVADPSIVENLEKAIRKINPWLLSEMTVEDIDKQIDDLQEMRVVALEREAKS